LYRSKKISFIPLSPPVPLPALLLLLPVHSDDDFDGDDSIMLAMAMLTTLPNATQNTFAFQILPCPPESRLH
jgi:hypothetical protein